MVREKPQFTLIAGPNGSGKSTFASDFLSPDTAIFDGDKVWKHYADQFNNDPLYQQFKESFRSREAIRAMGEEFRSVIKEAISQQKDFAYHSNFHTIADIEEASSFRQAGYQIHLLFFGLSKPAMAQQRVNIRSHSKDTHVQEPSAEQILTRYKEGLNNLKNNFVAFDQVSLIDNSQKETSTVGLPRLQLQVERGLITFREKNLPLWISKNLPKGLLHPTQPETAVQKLKKGLR